MKKLVILMVVVSLLCLIGCSGSNENIVEPIICTKNFTYVPALGNDVLLLNNWLKANPDKKVISFSGVLAYREDVRGYIIYFVSGNNSSQLFEKIGDDDSFRCSTIEYQTKSLQIWREAHPTAKMVSFSTVPSCSGGVKRFTICYEQ